MEAELAELEAVWAAAIERAPAVERLTQSLQTVNERLWDIEDRIREHEAEARFDATFIELARSVYHQNDQRAALKREVNDLLGSRLVEEKFYAPYSRSVGP